jgi:hypothetical protein
MTRLEVNLKSYDRESRNGIFDAFETNRDRRWLQDHIDQMTPAQRAALADADQRVLAIARATTDKSDQVDLWDALAYAGYPPEGPTRITD